jgi:hypothetical protein
MFSETSLDFRLTTWRYIPEDSTLQENSWFTNRRVRLKKKNLRGFGPLANYADRATAASWRSSTNFCG